MLIAQFITGLTLAGHLQPEATLPSGKIFGSHVQIQYDGSIVEQFVGIPYAKAPVADLRFKPPLPYGDLPDNFSATEFSPGCMADFGMYTVETTRFSEDCLFLNIWRPMDTKQGDEKAVIFVIHGGGYTAGDGSETDWRGMQLAQWGDVIVVNINYRLGIFGFLDLGIDGAPGNMGHMDQIEAMKWVKSNIRYFGGNPDQVTLFGVSAGSFSISMHLMTPYAKGLFSGAVMDAGVLSYTHMFPQHESLARARIITQALSCPSDTADEVYSCLMKQSADNLVKLQQVFSISQSVVFRPTYGSDYFPDPPEKQINNNAASFIHVPVIIGNSAKEGTFLMTEKVHGPFPDLTSVNETLEWNRFLAKLQRMEGVYNESNVIESYELEDGMDVYFYRNKSADFVGDGLFVCPVNNFVHHYSRHSMTYWYRWERLTNQIVVDDPVVFGAYHGSPFYHMIASQFVYYGSEIDPEDAAYSRDALEMLANFAKTGKRPRFRGLDLPEYNQDARRLFVFADSPYVRENHPRDDICNSVWSFFEDFTENTDLMNQPSTDNSEAHSEL